VFLHPSVLAPQTTSLLPGLENLAIEQSLLPERFQMFVVQSIRYRHKLLVPPALACLISADQQNCSASWIEGEQDTVGSSSVLGAQFLHVGVLRGRYRVHVGPAKRRRKASKQVPGTAFTRR
jgi:hypothetical protein